MTNKDITKIYFQGNEIVALYQGSTLIFKKSGGGSTGVYTVRGTVNPFSGEQSIQLCVNGKQEQFNVNSDNTFEHTFVNVPITNMDYFTQPCRDKLKTIDLSNFDTSQVTSMYEAFCQCDKLEEINLTNVDTGNVTNMKYMFDQCTILTSIDLSGSETTKLTSINCMFRECLTLKDLYINFDLKLISEYQMDIFLSCRSLTNVVGKFNNFKQYLDLSFSPLTPDSAMVFINGLATVTEKRRLSLSATTYDSLTTEQIAIATSKGWTVTRV